MTQITPESLRAILGDVDTEMIGAVQATGASLRDVEDAKAIAGGQSDIVGSGEQVVTGPMSQVLTLLRSIPDTNDKEIQRALLDPPAVYQTPGDVLSDQRLTKAQKVEILRRWEYDACEISVAEDEGMIGRDGKLLREILLALESLVGQLDSDRSPPTKQGGLDRQAVAGKPDQT